jgi:outer membrane protein W
VVNLDFFFKVASLCFGHCADWFGDFGGSGSKTVGKELWAPVVGLGVKTALNESWVFNTDLTYEWYQKARTGNVSGTTANALGTSVQPRLWNLTIGLSHKF